MLDRAERRNVGRAILDRINDWTDMTWIEAFWVYTKSQPPHYKFTTNTALTIELVEREHADVEIAGLAQDLISALGKVLSISSPTSVFRRLVGRNILTKQGRSTMEAKWAVLVDGLRHFGDLAKTLGVQAIPKLVEESFKPLPTVKFTSYIHYRNAIASPIRSRELSHAWLDTVRASGSSLMVHLFSLKLPALGPSFGVFHAVVEYKGRFYELQQVAGNLTNINISKWQPEATVDRPLVKTIVVKDVVDGALVDKVLAREFSGNDYRVLGDNCLVFANFLVYQLTGKVIPWKHFGAFGKEFSLNLVPNIRDYLVSHVWTDANEKRVSLSQLSFKVDRGFTPFLSAAKENTATGPGKIISDYGLHALRSVEAAIEAYDPDGPLDTPWSRDSLLDLAVLGYKRFGLSSHLVSQALLKVRMSKIPTRRRKINLLERLLVILRKFPSTRLAMDVVDLATATAALRMPLRDRKKPAWAPLVNISVPRHWFRDRDRLVESRHDPENLQVGKKKVVRLDLPQIARRYAHYFPGVKVPDIGFKYIQPGEYEIGVKVPIRTKLPVMDDFTWSLIKDLQEMHPFELGVFSLRFATEKMAEKVTDRYFTGTFDAGQLIPEDEQTRIADAIFENNRSRFANAQLLNPEEVWRKWHKNYSAGFPFRFNSKGRAKRSELIAAAGGKDAFLKGVRDYIASPEAFPTVSHAFIKDEVLPTSYIEREKIRTIIAQDPLNYFMEMAVAGDQGKRMDPQSFSAVGVSPAHGELAALAERHLAYKHHYAMDVTALDSTAAVDAIETIKKLRYRGFENHPQRENIKTLIDATLSNLQASWIVDIHTGRARFKRQGFTTGHATTTPDNTMYMEIMMIQAYHKITGRPYSQFYDDVKFSSFSDDNFWSTNLSKDVFSGKLISEYWLKNKVQVRVEGESDNLSDLSFLAKRFSFDPVHIDEVRRYAKRDARVAIVHDTGRLLQKFSDFKSKNTLAYRWQKLTALQLNCAHHKDIYDKVSEYLDALEKEMHRRKFLRTFMKQCPRKAYQEIMELMYAPGKNQTKLVVSTLDNTWTHDLALWWDTIRVDIMAFDGTANAYARVLQQFTGLLEIGGLNVEDPGVFLKMPGKLPEDPEFTLEHHCWLLNGCPSTYESFRMLIQKTPFASFCRTEEFWACRERFDISEECANGLRAKVLLLQGIYTIVAWLERTLNVVPVIGPIYRLMCTAKGMSEQMYSRLNALYYALFGDSSLVLSSLMPKDRYLSIKVLAFKVWCNFTSTDLLDFAADIEQFRAVADAASKLSQDVHNLCFEMDFSSLVPRPDTGENSNFGLENKWEALDHTASVKECVDLLADHKSPLVLGPTGCGKSTDFVVNLHAQFNTVLVSQPRRVLVKGSPVAQRKLYAGSRDQLTPGLINFGTAGYFRQVLGDLPEGAILVLDEFHELDEDTLWLQSRYPDRCIAITATPNFKGSGLFQKVRLSKSRNVGHSVVTEVRDTLARTEDVWNTLVSDEFSKEKTLCIVPSLKMVSELSRHATKLMPSKRVCELYRGHDEVKDADWYFATSVVDAGITIPNLTLVIDSAWSLGWKNGKFTRRPSSHNVSEQRRGRTGRTVNGTYIRLQKDFCDDPWDFSTPFIFNHWSVVKKWSEGLKRPPVMTHGVLEGLPFGYEKLMESSNWSALIYLVFYYQCRGDLDKTRASYQSAVKFPEHIDHRFMMRPLENRVFLPLEPLEASLKNFTIPGSNGNVWSWNGAQVLRENFELPIPTHLQDFE